LPLAGPSVKRLFEKNVVPDANKKGIKYVILANSEKLKLLNKVLP
jgi:hypothetical protein